MIGEIWKLLFGELSSTEISAFIAAIGFCINQISTWWKRRKDAQKDIVTETLVDAVMETSKDSGVSLNVHNDIPMATGQELLNAAAALAVTIGKSRGVDAEKILGGAEGVKSATQTTFKKIKNLFRD